MDKAHNNVVVFPLRWRATLNDRERAFIAAFHDLNEPMRCYLEGALLLMAKPADSTSRDEQRFREKFKRTSYDANSAARFAGIACRALALLRRCDLTSPSTFLRSVEAFEHLDKPTRDQRRLLGFCRRCGSAENVDADGFKRLYRLCRRAAYLLGSFAEPLNP